MRRSFLALLIGLMLAVSGRPAAAAPEMKDYMSTPFWLEGRTVPLVMLVLERDWKMFYPAYNNLSDLDGDGVIDIGFNPGVTYVGYFDSDSCYTYSGSGDNAVFIRSGPTTPQTEAQAANLAPADIKAQGRDLYKYDANGNRSNGQDGLNDVGIKIIRSKHGVCDRTKATGDGQGQWHGNWLNFATTSRMDAVRKVLYGGKRHIDQVNRTVLELTAYLPGNSHNWGGELVANDLWSEYARSSPWYDIPSFTGYITPAPGTMHFWARSSYYTTPSPTIDYASSTGVVNSTFMSSRNAARTYSPIPLFQFAAHIPATNYHPIYATPLRIWDWLGDHGAGLQPNDWSLVAGANASAARQFAKDSYPQKPANQVARRFNARVEVCKPDSDGNVAAGEGCRRYGDNYKPAGLLQQYGESEKMFFGLLTGTMQATTRWEGGVVRNHIQPFGNYVYPGTGIVVRPGDTVAGLSGAAKGSLIDTIDRLQVTGHGRFTLSGSTCNTTYCDGTQAGNPLGEMVYEAVRYLSRKGDNFLTPTSAYHPGSNGEVGLPPFNNNAGTLTKLHFENKDSSGSWGTRPGLTKAAENCPKPIILILSEVIPDHDKNDTRFNTNQSDFTNTPLLKDIETADVDLNLDISKYLDKISDLDNLKTRNNELFFYPNQTKAYGTGESRSARGVCEPSKLTNGLRDIDGHCPSEPSLEGSYSIAAIAYYAHTHNMYKVGNTSSDKPEVSIDTYAVGIPGNFPDITFTVDDKRSLTVMPITVAKDNDSNDNNGLKLRTLINFYVDSWEVDVKGHPYKVKFATNFEYTTTPAWVLNGGSNNMERDIFNRFEITLLTTKKIDEVSSKYREQVPIFINSGPFRTQDFMNTSSATPTTSNSKWLKAMDRWVASGETDASLFDTDQDNRPYYYAFRNPAYDPNDKTTPPLDLSTLTKYIEGVAIQNASFGSFINMKGHGGYTISGVTRPGPYIEVGYHGSDNTYFSNSNCHGRVPIVMTGDYTSAIKPLGVATGDWANCNGSVSSTFPDRRGLPPGHRNPDHPDGLLTPWECPFYGYTAADRNAADVKQGYPTYASSNPNPTTICGYNTASGKKMRYVQVRSFLFDENAAPVTPLPNPLWLAAKYGGFRDLTGNIKGVPDVDAEWKRGGTGSDKNDPYNYFGVANISELPAQLGKAFETIANSVGTGTANASSISSVLGGGLSIQTQYRPDYEDPKNASVRLKWTGSVYAFFVDKWGNLRADTNGNKKLELATSPGENQKYPAGHEKAGQDIWPDWVAAYNKSNNTSKSNWEELGDLIVHTVTVDGSSEAEIYLCRDIYGDNNGNTPLPSGYAPSQSGSSGSGCSADTRPYPESANCVLAREYLGRPPTDKSEVAYDHIGAVWNASALLSDRVSAPDGWKTRTMYTYYGTKPADGRAGWSVAPAFGLSLEDFPFSTVEGGANDPLGNLHKFMGQASKESTTKLIEYIQGKEIKDGSGNYIYRRRTANLPWAKAGDVEKTWVMGDVINAKPIIVGDAVANFHLLYGSPSYSDYKSSFGIYKYGSGNKGGGASARRQVAYFGTNGGVLHAINLGFFGALAQGKASYDLEPREPGYSSTSGYMPTYNNMDPGEEMWAYVPTAVLPHLQWLANSDYSHGFFVDLKPYATDITDATGRWKTILLVGLRLGGRTIELVNAGESETKYSYSEYFALDVTEPDFGPPKLLWRFSHPYLGLTSAMPTIVRSQHGGRDEWYAVLLSGPTSDVDSGGRRIPSANNPESAYQGRSTQKARVFILDARTGELMREPVEPPTGVVDPYPLVVTEPDSFFNDTFTPRAMYLVERTNSSTGLMDRYWSHHVIYMGLTSAVSDSAGYIRDSGALYRLQMVDTDGQPLPLSEWALRRMYNTDKPVTGAVNSAYDSRNNLWVVFGTGRVWGSSDLAPCGMDAKTANAACCDNHDQYFYGLKEPVTEKGYLTFEDLTDVIKADGTKLVDVSGVEVWDDGTLSGSPVQNLSATTYDQLYTGLINTEGAVKVGYKRKLEAWRTLYTCTAFDEDCLCTAVTPEGPRAKNQFEVVTTQPKIDGLANGRSNTVFTSYEVSANICDPRGRSFLNVVDTYTGLPAPYMGSYSGFEPGQIKSGGKVHQMTGIKRAGDYMASEAWVIKSGTQTVYGNTSFNSNRNMVYLPEDQSEGNDIVSWREVLDMGFDFKEDVKGFFKDLTTP